MNLKNTILFISILTLVKVTFASPLRHEFQSRNSLNTTQIGLSSVDSKLIINGLVVDSVPVAVIDSGVSVLHPLIMPQMNHNLLEIIGNNIDDDFNGIADDVLGYDFVNSRTFMIDDDGHGTHVSGIIAATNPAASIVAIKVLDANGDGTLGNILSAIRYAVSRKVKVINLSLGAMDVLGQTMSAYEEVIRIARENKILVVTAAGNNSSDNDQFAFYPSNTWQDNMLSVCATNALAQLASFSNYGAWKVHLCAPGDQIVSLSNNFLTTPWAVQSGTSQAAPFVAGAASILFGIKPDLEPYQVRDILMKSALKNVYLQGTSQTGGVLNLPGAIDVLVNEYL